MKVNTDDCMLWALSTNPKGYGRIAVKIDGVWRMRGVHRVLYEAEYGELPKSLVLDHLCRNTNCINLEHLEPVTNRENILRGVLRDLKTHCKSGHEFTEENTYMKPNGQRLCKACKNKWQNANYHKNYYKGKYAKS